MGNKQGQVKKIILFLGIIGLLLSCVPKRNNSSDQHTTAPKCVYVINTDEGYNVAYTEEGHTIMFETDSLNNYIVYYAKFDDEASKYSCDRFETKTIRAELDSTLSYVKNIVTIYGGFFLEKNDNGYCVQYFDDQINADSIDHVTFTLRTGKSDAKKISRIIILLDVACQISQSICSQGASGWKYISSALESSQDLLDYDVVNVNSVINNRINKRVTRINGVKDRFTNYIFMLQNERN